MIMINVEYLSKPENIYQDNTSSILEIPELSYFDGEQYDIYNEKDYSRFLEDIKRECRTSYEYRALINYINLKYVDSEVKVEIHHTPLTITDIISAVVRKRIRNQESIDIFDVCNEVMWLHYSGVVGLFPVNKTVHELIHNGYLFIPLCYISGNWRWFIDKYYDYIDPEVLDAIDAADQLTNEWLADQSNPNNPINYQNNIFNLHNTYISYTNNNYKVPDNIPKTRDILKDRIDAIKNNKKVMYRLVINPAKTSK